MSSCFLEKLSSLPSDKAKNAQPVNQRSENRACIVLLVGPTGAGKTSTIKHLFGHHNSIDFNLIGTKDKDKDSETRETVEFLPQLKSNQQKSHSTIDCFKNITLSVIDTPGFFDTAGMGQDARNLRCIQRFFEEYQKIPNLILFVMKAEENRCMEAHSQLATCLKLCTSKGMGLTDGSNMIIVLTHAMNIEQDERLWKIKADAKIKDMQEFAQKWTGISSIPVVLLDNNQTRLTKVKDRAKFPDRTLQRKNLFEAIINMFDAKGDIVGKMVIEKYFARERKDLKLEIVRGRSVKATLDACGDGFTFEEKGIYLELSGENLMPNHERYKEGEKSPHTCGRKEFNHVSNGISDHSSHLPKLAVKQNKRAREVGSEKFGEKLERKQPRGFISNADHVRFCEKPLVKTEYEKGKGLILVISQNNNRKETDIDVKAIKSTFEHLSCHVITLENCNKADLENALEKLRNVQVELSFLRQDYKYFFLFVLGQGGDGEEDRQTITGPRGEKDQLRGHYILDSEGKPVPTKLFEFFISQEFEFFDNKPKGLIYQLSKAQPQAVPIFPHGIVVHATRIPRPNMSRSFRPSESRFIVMLCKAIKNHPTEVFTDILSYAFSNFANLNVKDSSAVLTGYASSLAKVFRLK